MFERYSKLRPEDLESRFTTRHDSAVFVATGGDRISEAELRALRAAVVELSRAAGYPRNLAGNEAVEYDRHLAVLLHSHAGLVPAEAASRDLWAFLALCLLPDVAFWRFPTPPIDRVLGTDLTRHVFGRLWWRAQLVADPDLPDPYGALEILGEAAFDQIYARRTALGGSPALVQGILATWDERRRQGDFEGLVERDVLRDYLKRLLRLGSFVAFDALDQDAMRVELAAVADEAIAAVRAG
ncbi:DUF6339 family protein [Demequina maris]|uniref:DUF6339 family protein n=1 Tax=Demequina maris TaxID=1638982 RepID=UPI0007820A7D|nr:DUF6339 family protein [Demequina maris]